MSTSATAHAPSDPPHSLGRRGFTARRVLIAAVVAIVVQLLVRSWVAASGNFYFDDLILIGRGGTLPLLSGELLLYDHDGHFMPAAFVVAALTTKIAALEWWLPALTLVLMQAAASYAVFRLLKKLLGMRPALLFPLIFYLFSPLTLPSFAWWAAGLNALPLQFALAWVAGDALEFARTGRRRYVWSGAAVTAASLMFFEKSVTVPLFAFGVVALLFLLDGTTAPLRAAWNRVAALWLFSCAVVAVWAVAFLLVVRTGLSFHGVRASADLIDHGVVLGVLPASVGGPWVWERWWPAVPWATPPAVLVVVSVCVVASVVFFSVRRSRATAFVWLAVGGYLTALSVVMVLSRSGPDTASELAQSLRYYADSAVVISVALALVLRQGISLPRAVSIGAVAVFVVGSLMSTYTFVDKWQDDRTPDYVAAVRQSLTERTEIPLLDQPVEPSVLLPLAYPNNSMSKIFAGIPGSERFAESTPELQYIDEAGDLQPAVVAPTRNIAQGPDAGCGFDVDDRTRLPLGEPLPPWEWTVQLNYLASADGDMTLKLDVGEAVTVPLVAGLNTVYVRLSGSGSALTATPSTPGLSVCVGAGPVGAVLLASL